MGQLKLALPTAGGAGKRPLFVSKELTFYKGIRDRRTVDRHEGSVPPLTQLMDLPCGQLFSRAVFPGDQHPRITICGLRDHLPHATNRFALPHQFWIGGNLGAEGIVLAAQLFQGESVFHHRNDPVQTERLFKEIVGAVFHRAHGHIDRSMPADHNYRHAREPLSHFLQDV